MELEAASANQGDRLKNRSNNLGVTRSSNLGLPRSSKLGGERNIERDIDVLEKQKVKNAKYGAKAILKA